MPDLQDRPNSLPWPPILFAGSALIALGLQALLPLPWPGGAWVAVLAMRFGKDWDDYAARTPRWLF